MDEMLDDIMLYWLPNTGTSAARLYWEMTQACPLACRHCRAEAVPSPHPQELKFEEGIALLDCFLHQP